MYNEITPILFFSNFICGLSGCVHKSVGLILKDILRKISNFTKSS